MNRDFKNEYETHLDNEIPDLWSRIEPRLADKPAVKTVKKRKKRNLTFYYGIAAAGLLLAISVPVALRFASGSQRMDNSSSGGAQDFMAAQSADAADSISMNSESGGSVYQEEAAESEVGEDFMAPAMESADEAVEDSFLYDYDMENSAGANTVTNDSADNGSIDENDIASEAIPEASLDGLQSNDRAEGSQSEILIEITGIIQETKQYRDRIVYLLVVGEASEEAGLSTDDEIEIIQYLSDQEDPVVLPEGQTVRLLVLKNSAGTYELAETDSSRF